MTYKHILVAVELSEDSDVLIDKATLLAKKFDAEISMIYIDSAHGEIYTQLFDMKNEDDRANVSEKTARYFKRFIENSELEVSNALVGAGNISSKLPGVIDEYKVDLLVCGHHHDFWSHIISTSRQLINASPIDIMVVPIVE